MPLRELIARIGEIVGRPPMAWRRAAGGYSTAERWIVTFEDGRSCFAKSGSGHLATFLRAEFENVYSRLDAPFLPRVLGWQDDGLVPVLVLEDLSDAFWPPPWSRQQVEAVLSTLEDLQILSGHLTSIPDVETAHADAVFRRNWHHVQRDPRAFLSLGLCTEAWLRHSVRELQHRTAVVRLRGDDLLHADVRSDNMCFRGEQAVLIDWNHTCRGNRELDIAFWLPSLHSEGGPLPEDAYALAPEWAATAAGYFAARAGLPPIEQAPLVRQVQLSQLRSALPWAVRALDLPPLDGPLAPL